MKHIKHWLATMAVLLCNITASALDFEVEGICYNITSADDLTVEVTSRGHYGTAFPNDYSGAVTIPSTVIHKDKTYSVTSIGNYAFHSCSSLTSINIPASVTSIGNYTFSGCSSLTAITIPESVTSIENGAFAGCSSITTINVAEGNANYDSRGGCNAIIETGSNTLIAGCAATIIPESVTSIGAHAFDFCPNLTSITLPESVTNIADFAFRGCKFSSITIPEGVTYIGGHAFADCSNLTTINIPEGMTSIQFNTFANCSSLTTVILPESVTIIGTNAFDGCLNLAAITIPESVTGIGYGAFNGTAWYDNQPDGVIYAGNVLYEYKGEMLENTTIEVKEGVVSIVAGAFAFCNGLTSITIPESVTSIGEVAFEYCGSLTSITIPDSVTFIGDRAFKHCSNLKVVNNFSNLNIVKGSENHGYVAYYADVVVTKGLFLDFTELILTAGESATLTATIVPEENCTVEWSSSDNAVAVVDNQGKVTAVAAGTAIITAKAGEKMATCEVIVEAIPVSGITLNYTTVELAVGETLRLVATVTPDNAADKTVTWSSSNAAVASVDENGNVTIQKYGRTVTITATAGDCMAKCTIKINKAIEVGGVALNQTTANLSVGDTLTLVATVTPDNATNKTITWATSNNSVVAVNSNGIITAVAEGTATITAKVGDKEAVCIVTVSIPDSIEQLSIGKSKLVIYDLHGRRVENPTKGIYIINGRKVVIK